jgi:hypothetical protein
MEIFLDWVGHGVESENNEVILAKSKSKTHVIHRIHGPISLALQWITAPSLAP